MSKYYYHYYQMYWYVYESADLRDPLPGSPAAVPPPPMGESAESSQNDL
jgi:hypothetical protein